MATITKWSLTGQTLSGFTKGYDGNRGTKDLNQIMRSRVINFNTSTLNLNGLLSRVKKYVGTDTYAGYTALDQFAVIPINKGDVVLAVGCCVLSKDAVAGPALTIGDTGTATKFIASVTIDSGVTNGATTWSSLAATAYTTDDAVVAVLKTAVAVPTTAIVKISALIVSAFPEIAAAAL